MERYIVEYDVLNNTEPRSTDTVSSLEVPGPR